MALFWIIIVAGVVLTFWIAGQAFWSMFAIWILVMFWFSARPSHRQNVWVNYIFVIGLVALIAYLIVRSL